MTATPLMTCTPNFLPIPNVVGAVVQAPLAATDENDMFSKGVITKYFQNQSYGFVKDHLNRELFFHVDEMDFCGVKNNKKFITVGGRVGFDISRTSHGLRIKRIKIY